MFPYRLHRLVSFDVCSDSAGGRSCHYCQRPTARGHFRPRSLALSHALMLVCSGYDESRPLVCQACWAVLVPGWADAVIAPSACSDDD